MILHVWSRTRPEDQVATKQIVAQLAHTYFVDSILAREPDDYWKAWCLWWNIGEDIINIEQDNVPTKAQVDELAACPYPLCTYPYWRKEQIVLWDYLPDPTKADGPARDWVSLEEPIPDFVKGSGFGCVKIAKSVRDMVDIAQYPVEKYEWWSIDTWFSTELLKTGVEWHVHKGFVRHDRQWDWEG